jgi:DNA-binding Lrp family transcriptional regulator
VKPSDRLDAIDMRLLQRLQDHFPLDPRPYETIGRSIGLPEDVVLSRLAALRRGGVLERIAPVLETVRTGIAASTLVAMRIEPGRIEEVVRIVNEYPGVSHNYLRDHEFNLWFTIAEPSEADLEKTLAEILMRTGIKDADFLDLRTRRRFKIDVRFRFESGGAEGRGHGRD